MYTLLMLVLALLTVGWLLTVAPLSYFVTLIAGVPARESLRGKILRTSISERDGGVAFGGDTKVSFVKDPFAITQGVSALLLFIAGLIYFRFA